MDESPDERRGSGEASVGDDFSRLNPQKMSRGLDEVLVGVALGSLGGFWNPEFWVDLQNLDYD